MPRESGKPDHKAMSGEVDRLLRQLGGSDHEPFPSPSTTPNPAFRPGPRGGSSLVAPHGARPTTRVPNRAFTLPSPLGVWGRLGLAALLAGALTQWPYRSCGLPLAGYFASTTMSLVTGVWTAHSSWRRRMGLAHVLAVAVLFVGAALVLRPLLPHLYVPGETAWRCAR